jgi:hypothetical protein
MVGILSLPKKRRINNMITAISPKLICIRHQPATIHRATGTAGSKIRQIKRVELLLTFNHKKKRPSNSGKGVFSPV